MAGDVECWLTFYGCLMKKIIMWQCKGVRSFQIVKVTSVFMQQNAAILRYLTAEADNGL